MDLGISIMAVLSLLTSISLLFHLSLYFQRFGASRPCGGLSGSTAEYYLPMYSQCFPLILQDIIATVKTSIIYFIFASIYLRPNLKTSVFILSTPFMLYVCCVFCVPLSALGTILAYQQDSTVITEPTEYRPINCEGLYPEALNVVLYAAFFWSCDKD